MVSGSLPRQYRVLGYCESDIPPAQAGGAILFLSCLALRTSANDLVEVRQEDREEHAGVLLFVPLTEHYAPIVTDEAAAAHVVAIEVARSVGVLIVHMRNGRGLPARDRAMRNVLRARFPREGTANDGLSDRIHVI